MMGLTSKLIDRVTSLFPQQGFFFDRPILLLHSDDWGRVGVRDQEGLKQLAASGLTLGERAYDLYSLETAGDLMALSRLLKSHRDAVGRPACIGMNFITANLDFRKMRDAGFREMHLRPLADGLPAEWNRPGLLEGYREGMEAGVFFPALHGETHFCRRSADRAIATASERANLLKTLWAAGTPYIHWRMPWIGYEYWEPDPPEVQRFLNFSEQQKAIGAAVGNFTRLFSALPRSACAPGYRANADTHRAWTQYGVQVAQNGPGTLRPPHLDSGGLLHLYRSIDFEPALDKSLNIDNVLRTVSDCFNQGMPAIVSVHSINFHSTICDFRTRTLELLDQLLSALESKYPQILYVHDADVYDLVQSGCYAYESRAVTVRVSKQRISRRQVNEA
jgi:hypothetical protein